jgi:hypothetical protein
MTSEKEGVRCGFCGMREIMEDAAHKVGALHQKENLMWLLL